MKSYIQVHIRPMMTLGRAQGTTTSARASAAPPEALVEQERGAEAEQKLQPDHADDPDGRVPERDPEDLIVQDGYEIPEADEGGCVGFVEQIVVQAEPDRLRDRHENDRCRERAARAPGTRPASNRRGEMRSAAATGMPVRNGRRRATARRDRISRLRGSLSR